MNIIAGFLSGLVGAMGLGGGSFLILYLTLLKDTPQLKAQGINLIFFVPCALISIILCSKNKLVKWDIVVWVAIGGILGVVCGCFLVSYIHPHLLSKIFGGFLILFGAIQLFSKDKVKDKTKDKIDEKKAGS